MSSNWTTKEKIADVVAATQCAERAAVEYLLAEEGSVVDAVISYLGDYNLARLRIRYDGSSQLDTKIVDRSMAHLYPVGSTWASADGSTRYTVVRAAN